MCEPINLSILSDQLAHTQPDLIAVQSCKHGESRRRRSSNHDNHLRLIMMTTTMERFGAVCDTIRCEEGRKADMWLRQASSAIAPAVQCNAITLAIQCNTENSSSVYCVHNMCFHCTMALQHWYVMGVLAEPGSTRQPSPLHSAYLRVTICCPVRDCCYFFVLLEHLRSFVHLFQSWNPVENLK